jgi:hypothetical protein
MKYLQYTFYAINIYLEKVIEDFCEGNTRARQSGNPAARANLVCRRHWFCKRLYAPHPSARTEPNGRSGLQLSWCLNQASRSETRCRTCQIEQLLYI